MRVALPRPHSGRNAHQIMIIIERQIGECGSQSLPPQVGLVAGFGLVVRGVRLGLLTERAQPDAAIDLPILRLGTDDHEGHVPMVTAEWPLLAEVVTNHTDSAQTRVARDQFLSPRLS